MTNTTEMDKARRQIRALLNLGNDDGAAEAEAENALRFARRLMLRHNLTEQELSEKPKNPHELAAEVEYGTAEHFTKSQKLARWESTLHHAVCGLVGTVKGYVTRGQRRSAHGTLLFDEDGMPDHAACLVFYGPQEDCQAARELQEEWTTTIAAMARLRFGGVFRGPGRSYCEGFSQALYEKSKQIQTEEVKEIQAHRESTNQAKSAYALVLVQATDLMKAKRDYAQNWLQKTKGIRLSTRSGGYGGRHHGDAYSEGRADGRRAGFQKGEARRRLGQ